MDLTDLDAAIDLLDEAASAVKVARETKPEAIDILERKKFELEVEIHALEVRCLQISQLDQR